MDFDEHDDPDDDMGLPKPTSDNPQTQPTPRKTTLTSTPSSAAPKYRECLKNHAVTIGGHAVDGCGEFMPAGEEGTLDALRCAACNCHRNFHRKDSDSAASAAGADYHHQFSPYYRTPAGYLHHHHPLMLPPHQRAPPPPPLALPSTSGGGGGQSRGGGGDEEELSDPMGVMGSGSGSGKKRFRTKFSQEQKEKMLAFAERVGWRIQKHDEAAVMEFCNETGVKRHVLKVWMHNNKHTLGGGSGGTGGVGTSGATGAKKP